MKQINFLAGIFCLFSTQFLLANCPTAAVALSTQLQIDAFATTYAGCTEMPFDLWIQGNDITNLNGLANLSAINGNLQIDNCANLTNFSGLQNIGYIGGNFDFYNLPNLQSCAGLESLAFVNGQISIKNNAKLVDFQGFTTLSYIGQSLIVDNCDALVNCNGLAELQTVNKDFKISGNEKLENFVGLSKLETINGVVEIKSNGIFSTIGFDKLVTIGGYFWIENNAKLVDLVGFPALKNLFGNIQIGGNSSMKKIDGFNFLTQISGDLQIYNTGIDSLSGFQNVAKIYGKLNISDNYNLVFMDILPALTEITGSFYLNPNKIQTFNGFNNLENIIGSAQISGYNSTTKTLGGFEKLKKITGNFDFQNLSTDSISTFTNLEEIGLKLEFYHCDFTKLNGFNTLKSVGSLTINNNSFISINGFKNLPEIKNQLTVDYNPLLTKINGFDSLKIVRYFWCSYHQNLTEINAFKNLKTISRDLTFQANYKIAAIDFFENLEKVGWKIQINSNVVLSDCNIFLLCEKLAAFPDSVMINSNGYGCNNKNEAAASCAGLFPHVKGTAFFDFDCNGQLDSTDKKLTNHILRNAQDLPFATTNWSGNYVRLLQTNQNYTFKPAEMLGYLSNPTDYSVKAVDYSDSFPNRDFRLCPDGDVYNLNLSVSSSGNPRPGFSTTYTICAQNIGNQPVSSLLVLDIPNPFQNGNIASWTSSISTNSTSNPLLFDVPFLQPFDQFCFTITIKWATNLVIGSEVSMQFNLLLNGADDAAPTNNIVPLRQTVIGSYDPNDKTVNQPRVTLTPSIKSAWLDYQIRFQNTGNFPADFVHILDTLDTNLLDLRTLQMLQASHNYTLEFPAPDVLKWRFDDIFLPDSTSSEAASHGFLLFRIKTKENVHVTDTIFNRCGIYFDFNAPVITNFAKTSFEGEFVSIDNLLNINELRVQPNPASDEIQLSFLLKKTTDCQLEMFNALGKSVQKMPSRTFISGKNTVALPISTLETGIYFLKISAADGQTGVVRFVKK
jgi:hypothetical protein